jgi:hypothetical protein
MKLMLIPFLLFASTASAGPWSANPRAWSNSDSNFLNTSRSWDSNPRNFDNVNPWGGHPKIYDSGGELEGYAVPRSDGGWNLFDRSGERQGYVPGE